MIRTFDYLYDPSTAKAQRRRSHRLAWLLCAGTLGLLTTGALVSATGSGLAIPDWPLAYGQLFPPLVGGILYQQSHRLAVAVVFLLTLAETGWLWHAEPRRWVRLMATAMVATIIVLWVLGGLSVVLLLPRVVSIAHAWLAQCFFLSTVTLVQVTAPGWEELPGQSGQRIPGHTAVWASMTLAAMLVALFLGAMAHDLGAGPPILESLSPHEGLVPSLMGFPYAIYLIHGVGGVVVAVLVGVTLWETLRHHGGMRALKNPALAMAGLMVLQLLLGGAAVWSQRSVSITTLHLLNGALLTATTGLLALRGWVVEHPARRIYLRSPAGFSPR